MDKAAALTAMLLSKEAESTPAKKREECEAPLLGRFAVSEPMT